MLINNKDDFNKVLELTGIMYTLYYPYEKSREHKKAYVFKYNDKLCQILGEETLNKKINHFDSTLSGGTIQSIEKGEWFEASKEEKEKLKEMIEYKEHKDKIFSGKYNVYEKIDEKEYKDISEILIKYCGINDYNFDELIIVKKESKNK